MKKVFSLTAAAFAASANSAWAAVVCDPRKNACDVPEISALEGTAALAALAAVVLIAWERRRRAA